MMFMHQWNLFHSYGIYFTVMESISQLWNLFHSYGIYFTVKGSDLFYLEKDILSDNMVKRLVITKDKLSTVLKMGHNSSGHQGVNKTVHTINECYYWKGNICL
jgi:hypothetical protein